MVKTRFAFGYVDASKAAAKLRKLRKTLKKRSKTLVKDMVDYGKNYARQYVPYYTGQTYDLIKGDYKSTDDGEEGTVYIQLKDRYDSRRNSVEVVQAMDPKIGGASFKIPQGYIRSGSPRFFSNTRKKLEEIKGTKVQQHFTNIKIMR